MNKAIAVNKQIGFIRVVKGVIIGQLLISIVGFGALFELYSANFLACLERRIAYYAAPRSV